MRVLVTGGSGFIGAAVVDTLLEQGARVSVLDRQAHRSDRVASIVGDIRDRVVVERALSEKLDAVIHLAALTSVLESVKKPTEVFDTNVTATAGLLEACRTRGVSRLVMASTNAVVGSSGEGVISERSPLAPLTPYGASKAAAEMLLSCYSSSYGLAACAVRLTNVYGPGMRNKDSVVARLMRAALAHEPIQIYGDGKQTRDYVFVEDAAGAIALIAAGEWTGTFVVGSGHSVSVNELHAQACEATGVDIPAAYVSKREGEMPAVEVDITRAGSIGFEPLVSLAEGLKRTWAYFQK